jgi:hypothetical protein
MLKGMRMHFISQEWYEKLFQKKTKTTKNNFRRNNHEVCTAVTRCFPNILDVMIVENINLPEDTIGRPPLSYCRIDLDFCHLSAIYSCQQCVFQQHVNFICPLT